MGGERGLTIAFPPTPDPSPTGLPCTILGLGGPSWGWDGGLGGWGGVCLGVEPLAPADPCRLGDPNEGPKPKWLRNSCHLGVPLREGGGGGGAPCPCVA